MMKAFGGWRAVVTYHEHLGSSGDRSLDPSLSVFDHEAS